METETTTSTETSTAPKTPQIPEDAIDVSEAKDKGVVKKILREGTGTDLPGVGDKVSVHYVGTLWGGEKHGHKFDSSRDRGELFDFDLGQGKVIKGWDEGVVTMKKGELADFYITPDYAYGKAGSGANIPSNSTLKFEVELISWTPEDISPDKDQSVSKSILQKGGTAYQSPDEDSAVEVSIIGSVNGLNFDERPNFNFTIGEGSDSNVPEGVELALKKMRQGERARVTVKPKLGFGARGNEALGVPANATLSYELTLHKFEKAKESWRMEKAEKVETSELLRTKGATLCHAGKWDKAAKLYKKITSYLEFEGDFKEEELRKKRDEIILAAHLNLALCHLKTGDFKASLEAADKALTFDKSNEKALFRRAQAKQHMNEWEEAIDAYKKVLEVAPGNEPAKQNMAACESSIEKQKQKEKSLYSSIFKKLAAQLESEKGVEEEKPSTESTSPKKSAESSSANGDAAAHA